MINASVEVNLSADGTGHEDWILRNWVFNYCLLLAGVYSKLSDIVSGEIAVNIQQRLCVEKTSLADLRSRVARYCL